MSVYKDTAEQVKIIDIISTLKKFEILKILAYAGCGKSSTLKRITQVYSQNTFAYFAFNNENVNEAKKDFNSNVFVSTLNSFAKKGILRTDQILREQDYNMHDISDILNIPLDSANKTKTILNYYLTSGYLDIRETANDLVIGSTGEFELTQKLYDLMESGSIEVTHDYYMKAFQLKADFTKYNYDYVMLDEAQDTNDVAIEIFKKFNAAKIAVGDDFQQIYLFRGSDNALHKLDATYTKYLSSTFRCQQHIVDIANSIIVNIRNAKQPLISKNTVTNPVIKTTAYITRTNAKLIEAINVMDDFRLIRKPSSIFKSTINLHFFLTKNYDKIAKEFKYLLRFKNKSELVEHAKKYNRVEITSALAIAQRYKGYLFVLFKKAKNHNNKSNTIITTVHSSKGLEFDRVLLLNDFKHIEDLINIQGTNPREFIEETNLRYVAVTRARYEIANYRFVYED